MPVSLTTDRDTHLQDLAEHGYCLVQGALSSEEVEELRGQLVEIAAREMIDGTAFVYDDGQRVFSLLNKGDSFVRMGQHPLALEFAEHVLGPHDVMGKSWAEARPGPHFLLSNLDANISGPGGKRMNLHNDQGMVPPPWHAPVVLNVAWMLDDFTAENGATRVVPGSHLSSDAPDADPIPICGPAGSAMVFEGRLWHQTGANVTTSEKRHALFTYYCAPFLRTQENYFLSLEPSVLESATPVLRRLLGYEPYLTLGSNTGADRTGPRGRQNAHA